MGRGKLAGKVRLLASPLLAPANNRPHDSMPSDNIHCKASYRAVCRALARAHKHGLEGHLLQISAGLTLISKHLGLNKVMNYNMSRMQAQTSLLTYPEAWLPTNNKTMARDKCWNKQQILLIATSKF